MARRVTAVIQAGGKSSRMGAGIDKAFALLDGKPLIEHVLERVRQIQPDEILIISNQPERYPAYDKVSIHQDLIADQGPLGGILTALELVGHENVVMVACDMPYLNPALLEFMIDLQLASPHDAVVPRLRGQVQGLHTLYRKACLPVIRRRLESQQLSLTGLLLELNVRFIDEAEYAHLDADGRSFTNINTPDELQSAQDG